MPFKKKRCLAHVVASNHSDMAPHAFQKRIAHTAICGNPIGNRCKKILKRQWHRMKKSPNPLVSVVIPTYKREKVLQRTLQSVVDQTYSPLEIIIVDDSPQKKSDDFFTTYKKENIANINYIHRPQKAGATTARNRGIIVAKGKYIATLDDDDLWAPEKIEKQVQVLEHRQFKHINICVTWINDLRFGYKRINKTPEVIDHQYVIRAFNVQSTSAYLFRAAALKQAKGFDETLASAHEYDLAIRLSKDAPIISICEPLVTQMETAGQISEDWKRKIQGMLGIFRKHHPEYTVKEYGKFLGIIGLYLSAYVCGNKIHKMIIPMKERMME